MAVRRQTLETSNMELENMIIVASHPESLTICRTAVNITRYNANLRGSPWVALWLATSTSALCLAFFPSRCRGLVGYISGQPASFLLMSLPVYPRHTFCRKQITLNDAANHSSPYWPLLVGRNWSEEQHSAVPCTVENLPSALVPPSS